ncbi:MAG TPA: FKBP-type peptidyl-prolyl cis-trans isomerase [Solirubrobacterales bacterium]|nr:FKBP-type peptidyl-prolyl cis-trans isomerase [Solirubrobacterales bacterium]
MQRLFLIIIACLAVLGAGCGGDSSDSTATPGEKAVEQVEQKEKAVAKEEKEAEEKAAEEEKKRLAELPKPNVPGGPPPKTLVTKDKKTGSGATAKSGVQVSVHYVGVVYTTEELFDANWGEDEPFSFKLGAGEVIKGWDKGVQGMKVGGQRELIIPPNLAYGPEGVYPSIPPNATLVFLVELLGVG